VSATPRLRGRTIADLLGATLSGREVDAAEERASASIAAMRDVYEEQAARGIPEAIEGLAMLEQGRWPSTGRPMDSPLDDEGSPED
jgi:hypothetical protein